MGLEFRPCGELVYALLLVGQSIGLIVDRNELRFSQQASSGAIR